MDDMNMLDGTVDEVITRIERCMDPLVLDQARREELNTRSRANVVRALNRRMAELPDPGEEPDTAANLHELDSWEFTDIPSTADQLKTDWPIGEDPKRKSPTVNLVVRVEEVLVVQALDPVAGLVTDESRDDGQTWTRVETLPLPEPGSEAWEELERRADEWHASADTRPVHEYLGITLEQYARWVEYRKPDPLAGASRPLVEEVQIRKFHPGGALDRLIQACTDARQVQVAIQHEEARKRPRKPLLEALLERLAALLGGTVTGEARALMRDALRDEQDEEHEFAAFHRDRPIVFQGDYREVQPGEMIDTTASVRFELDISAAPWHVKRMLVKELPTPDLLDEQDGEPQAHAPYPPVTGDAVLDDLRLLAKEHVDGTGFSSDDRCLNGNHPDVDGRCPVDGGIKGEDPMRYFEARMPTVAEVEAWQGTADNGARRLWESDQRGSREFLVLHVEDGTISWDFASAVPKDWTPMRLGAAERLRPTLMSRDGHSEPRPWPKSLDGYKPAPAEEPPTDRPNSLEGALHRRWTLPEYPTRENLIASFDGCVLDGEDLRALAAYLSDLREGGGGYLERSHAEHAIADVLRAASRHTSGLVGICPVCLSVQGMLEQASGNVFNVHGDGIDVCGRNFCLLTLDQALQRIAEGRTPAMPAAKEPSPDDMVPAPRAPLLAVLDLIGARFDSPGNWLEAARRFAERDEDAPNMAPPATDPPISEPPWIEDVKPLSEFRVGDVGEAVGNLALYVGGGATRVPSGQRFAVAEIDRGDNTVMVVVESSGRGTWVNASQTARIISRAQPAKPAPTVVSWDTDHKRGTIRTVYNDGSTTERPAIKGETDAGVVGTLDPSPLVEHGGRWYLAGERQQEPDQYETGTVWQHDDGEIFRMERGGPLRREKLYTVRPLHPLPLDPPSGYRWAGEWQATPPDENDLREWYMGDGEDLHTSEGVVYFWRAGDACRPVERIVDEPRTVPSPFWQSYLAFPLDQCIQRLADDHQTLLDVIAHRDGYEELVDALVVETNQDDRQWLRDALAYRAAEIQRQPGSELGQDPGRECARVALENTRLESKLNDVIGQRDALREQVQRLEQQNRHLVERVKRYSAELMDKRQGPQSRPDRSGLSSSIFNQVLSDFVSLSPEERATAVPYTLIDELHRAEADARAMRMKLRLAGVNLED